MNIEENKNENADSYNLEYRFISRDKLKAIKTLWAMGSNIDKIRDISLHPQLGKYTILCADMSELIERVDFLGLDPKILFCGDEFDDSVTNGVIKQWVNGGFMDPPTLTIGDSDRLQIADGRHRTIAAYQIGLRFIPVAVHVTMVNHVKKFISLSEC